MTSCDDLNRRGVIVGGAALGFALSLGGTAAMAQEIATTAAARKDSAEADRIVAEFLGGATALATGLELDMPALADNPASVTARIHVTEAITDDLWCEEIILIAERNPAPLAGRIKLSALAGVADVSMRMRLIETMPVRALARMSDGRFLEARKDITVAAGGCGM